MPRQGYGSDPDEGVNDLVWYTPPVAYRQTGPKGERPKWGYKRRDNGRVIFTPERGDIDDSRGAPPSTGGSTIWLCPHDGAPDPVGEISRANEDLFKRSNLRCNCTSTQEKDLAADQACKLDYRRFCPVHRLVDTEPNAIGKTDGGLLKPPHGYDDQISAVCAEEMSDHHHLWNMLVSKLKGDHAVEINNVHPIQWRRSWAPPRSNTSLSSSSSNEDRSPRDATRRHSTRVTSIQLPPIGMLHAPTLARTPTQSITSTAKAKKSPPLDHAVSQPRPTLPTSKTVTITITRPQTSKSATSRPRALSAGCPRAEMAGSCALA